MKINWTYELKKVFESRWSKETLLVFVKKDGTHTQKIEIETDFDAFAEAVSSAFQDDFHESIDHKTTVRKFENNFQIVSNGMIEVDCTHLLEHISE